MARGTFNVMPPDFDGGMRPIGMFVVPNIQMRGFTLNPPNSTLESRNEIPVCSRDGILQEDTITGYFPGLTHAWAPEAGAGGYQGRQDQLSLSEHHAACKGTRRDPAGRKNPFRRKHPSLKSLSIFQVSNASRPGEGDHYAIVTPEQNVVSGLAHATPFSTTAAMAPGSYVMSHPSPWGATGAMALDDGYVASVYAKSPGYSVRSKPRQHAAGV